MNLIEKADSIRREVMRVAVANGAGHIAPSLSCIDILTALYYRVLEHNNDPQWENRDRLVFSKAHGCYGLYAILADIGFIRTSDWETFYKGSTLAGCVERDPSRGIEASCGSLGHGLPMATGLAFGAKLQSLTWRTYCIVGDGELQEGSNWEAIQFAVRHKLDNLTIIVDTNGLQAMDFLNNILTVPGKEDDIRAKTEGFGCACYECNGHDTNALAETFLSCRADGSGKPRVVIARTVKGYGVTCMENIPKFHFRIPTDAELAQGGRYEQ